MKSSTAGSERSWWPQLCASRWQIGWYCLQWHRSKRACFYVLFSSSWTGWRACEIWTTDVLSETCGTWRYDPDKQ